MKDEVATRTVMANKIERTDRARLLPSQIWTKWVRPCCVLSVLYVWAYFMSVALVLPLQEMLLPTTAMSILYLPHGVRVLAAWLYGWRSVLFLLPGALLCGLHFAANSAVHADFAIGVIASLLASPLAFAVARFVFGSEIFKVGVVRVPVLMAVGLLAAVFNLVALRLAYGLHPLDGLVILIGDTGGLIVTLIILWLGLKLLPNRA